jgi:homoserine dehydrogenase
MKIKTASLILLGFGRVGRALLKQLLDNQDAIRKQCNVFFSIAAVADSRAVVGSRAGLSVEVLNQVLLHKEGGLPLSDFPGSAPLMVLPDFFASSVLLADTSASIETAPLLRLFIESGGGIALANKLPLAQPWQEACIFFNNPHVRYEATVGAGLPVIASLISLLANGDRLTMIEGGMSGTLGYLTSALQQGRTFSDAVMDAFTAGYTEPDPRQDLGGLDVARKALILARTAGSTANIEDINLDPFCADTQGNKSVQQFLDHLPEFNNQFMKRSKLAAEKGNVLRYLARVAPDEISVGMVEVPEKSSLGTLVGTDNFFAFHSNNYNSSPLVISGPGAGIAVTAAGVISDLISLAVNQER